MPRRAQLRAARRQVLRHDLALGRAGVLLEDAGRLEVRGVRLVRLGLRAGGVERGVFEKPDGFGGRAPGDGGRTRFHRRELWAERYLSVLKDM